MIDLHSHFFPTFDEATATAVRPDAPWLRQDSETHGMIIVEGAEFRPVDLTLWNPTARLARLDELGIDVQAVSTTPVLFGYHFPLSVASDWCRLVNDAQAAFCAADGAGRMRSLCQVPLQDTEAACRELDRCIEAGHTGVQIGTHVGDRALSDPQTVDFLNHCAATGVPVFVHPWDMKPDPRMDSWMLQWLVGMPAETQLSVLGLALSGAFDRLDPRLRICFAHGGGSFAFLLGRADNAWHRRDIVRRDSTHPPSHYTDRFMVDSAVFDEGALRLLLDVMGPDRVALGSDMPFPLGEEIVGALVRAAGIDDATRNAVLDGNGRRFLGLDRP